MDPAIAEAVFAAFRRTAQRVPAYQSLLAEAGITPESILRPEDFSRLPILEKRNTFQRFPIEQLCVDGEVGRLSSVLTSSGHSGVFAFGLADADAAPPNEAARWIDDLLDYLFQVRSQRTLLINCLPMGVKVPTEACTLAETSVRPDMAVALVKAFGKHYRQTILVGEAAFIKHLLELGRRTGVDWKRHRVHVIVGEEPLAENARTYLGQLLGHDEKHPERGLIVSSMGVAEIGLNLFFEVPPVAPLIQLRRLVHEHSALRAELLGDGIAWAPSFFTYDPRRIYVEFRDDGALVLTTLDPRLRLPLVRYATGDRGAFLRVPSSMYASLGKAGLDWTPWADLPAVMIHGRGAHALAGEAFVYPEAVKEGIYLQPELAELTTANFRLVSGNPRARVRVQLSPGITPTRELSTRFSAAIARYVTAPLEVVCETYESFGSGMTLDYERKFSYLTR